MLYTMQGLNLSRFDPVVALARPNSELKDFYTENGFETLCWSGIELWDHSVAAPKRLYSPRTWVHLWRVWRYWKKSQSRTLELLETVKPDIVHLNSMPLSPCADILNRRAIKFVWHVREPPPNQGLRTKIIQRIMYKAPRLIFISNYDKEAWVGNAHNAVVIKNFIDLEKCNTKIDPLLLRNKFNLKPDYNVILHLGGISEINGIFTLLRALKIVRKLCPKSYCLMPASIARPPATLMGRIARAILPLVGSGTLAQKVAKLVHLYDLESISILMPFSREIPELLSVSDILVVPYIKPHFARPVIEASAMRVPSVGSDIGGVNELIEHESTGLLVKPGSPEALAVGITDLLLNKQKTKKYGYNAYKKAKKEFNGKKQMAKIIEVYNALL